MHFLAQSTHLLTSQDHLAAPGWFFGRHLISRSDIVEHEAVLNSSILQPERLKRESPRQRPWYVYKRTHALRKSATKPHLLDEESCWRNAWLFVPALQAGRYNARFPRGLPWAVMFQTFSLKKC